MTKQKNNLEPYLVLRDTRERYGWDFPKTNYCLGTESATLKTGDYTLRGYEDIFVVERKWSTGELADNLTDKRFDRELERLEQFQYPFIICEFTYEQVFMFPRGSRIPENKWQYLRVSNNFLIKRINDILVHYKTKIIFAGSMGEKCCSSLFKRIVENVPPSGKQ